MSNSFVCRHYKCKSVPQVAGQDDGLIMLLGLRVSDKRVNLATGLLAFGKRAKATLPRRSFLSLARKISSPVMSNMTYHKVVIPNDKPRVWTHAEVKSP